MKRKSVIISLAFVLSVIMLTGCAGIQNGSSSSFGTVAYNALLISKEAYVHNFENFDAMHEQGLITDEAYERGYEYAVKYYNAWMAAMDAVIAYEKMQDLPSKEKAKALLNLLRGISKDVFDFLDDYLLPDKEMILKEVR